MSPPSHVILPLSGAAVLAAAVLGVWLWPTPAAPPVNLDPPPVAEPVITQPSAPPPPPVASPRPVVRAPPPPPPVAAPPPPPPVAPPVNAVQMAPPPPSYPVPNVPEDGSPPPGLPFSMKGRAAAMLEYHVTQMEKERDEARARGDDAEYQRLEEIVRQSRERLEQVRAQKNATPSPEM
jgi:hypothetical protein